MNKQKSSKFHFGVLVILIACFAVFCSNQSKTDQQTIPQIAELTIPVTGMTCGSCEHHIETEVKKQDGIIEIHADHENAVVHAKFDSSKLSLDELIVAINSTGYQAQKP